MLRGNVPDDRIKGPVHPFHVHIRDLDPELILDLVEQFGEGEVGIGLANIVILSHTHPAGTELLNIDLANPDGDVLGDATAAVMSLVEGSIVQLRLTRQLKLEG